MRILLVAMAALVTVTASYLTVGRGGGVTVDGPVVAHDAGWGLGGSAGNDALVGGVLERDGDCLLLDGNVVVWPDGTTWADDEEAVRLESGRVVREGDGVRGGGGMAAEDPDSADSWTAGSDAGRMLAGCLEPDGAAVVFNADAELEIS